MDRDRLERIRENYMAYGRENLLRALAQKTHTLIATQQVNIGQRYEISRLTQQNANLRRRLGELEAYVRDLEGYVGLYHEYRKMMLVFKDFFEEE